MNGFSALREWEMISLALGDREDMSKRADKDKRKTRVTLGTQVWHRVTASIF